MPYNPALDGVRAVAVLIVLAFHCRLPGFGGGYVGVDVFFVLSGYLITTILRAELEATGQVAIGRFYWRRALRLWPPLLLMLCAYIVAAPVFFSGTNVVRDVLVTGFYLSDYSQAIWGLPKFLGHTWSLSVEEHFYLLWPLAILATRRLTDRQLAWLLGALFVLATAWRCADMLLWRDWAWTYYRFDTRMSGLVLGGAIAVLPWRMKAETARLAATLSVLLLVSVTAAFRWDMPEALTWGGLVVDLAAAGLILSLASSHALPLRGLFESQPAVYLGLVSYSIYLWHYPIARIVRDHFDPLTTFLIVAPLSVALAAASYEYMEKPLRALRRRQAAAA